MLQVEWAARNDDTKQMEVVSVMTKTVCTFTGVGMTTYTSLKPKESAV